MQIIKSNLSKKRKFIFITGGVLSGLGKGVVSASLGKLFNPKLNIICIKCDGYLNVDPGTMSPFEHGELYVLKDGGEVDLDFGHYERFLNINCKKNWSITSGKVFQSLTKKERKGDFLGKTVQVIPHVTGEIRSQLCEVAEKENADIVLVEIGGTVGDLENLWFLEACREMLREFGSENVMFVHLGLIPVIDQLGQQKTKPLQQSIINLRDRGIIPDVVVGRSKEILFKNTKDKLQYLFNLKENCVISDPDLNNVYELPLIFEKEGLKVALKKHFNFKNKDFNKLIKWKKLVNSIKKINYLDDKSKIKNITIAIAGKYCDLADSYISIRETLQHCSANLGVKINIKYFDTENFENKNTSFNEILNNIDGVIIPGGFGSRGIEGKIKIINYLRINNIPFLGICYGLQLAVVEYARNVCDLKKANTVEINEKTKFPIIDILPGQKDIKDKGGTMRLGSYEAILKKGSIVSKLYKSDVAFERHRHRYEVNPKYHKVLQEKGLIFSGMSPDKTLVEYIELKNHKYFVATQSHPELKSRLEKPAPLFMGLIKAIIK